MADVDYYFERFGWQGRQLSAPVPAELGMVVVIPCHDEPDLTGSLQALHECDQPTGQVEVIVVINAAAGSAVVEQNRRTGAAVKRWRASLEEEWFDLHVLEENELPKKHAGVGLARKIGMDEAIRRFADVGRVEEGVIVCFDADCRCDPNLLTEIAGYFNDRSHANGCSVCFEHPVAGEEASDIYRAIVEYELHLRYFIQACRHAGHPFAFHTVGSSMAVRAGAYVKQGGMNKRQAGEDFYFLQKIIPLGGFGELNSTRVIPSPRVSDRVPFGTGKAVADHLRSGGRELLSYPLQPFEDMKELFAWVMAGAEGRFDANGPLRRFLDAHQQVEAVRDIRAQTTNCAAFQKRFFRWFDAFKLMKYVHFARDEVYGPAPITDVARRLVDGDGALDLLRRYRHEQRRGWVSPLG